MTMFAPWRKSVVRFDGSVVAERLVAALERLREAGPHLRREGTQALLPGAERAQLGAGANGSSQTHHLHAAVHDTLVQLRDVGGNESDPFRHPDDFVVELIGGERAVRPTELD